MTEILLQRPSAFNEASPKQFVTHVRMNATRSLLLDRVMSAASNAAAVGYSNCGFFGGHFKQAYRISPSEDRDASGRG